MENVFLINGTQENVMYIFDEAEAYFGSPEKRTFDETVFYRLGNTFLTSMKTLVGEIADSECDLPEKEVPKKRKERMDVVIPENRTRKK